MTKAEIDRLRWQRDQAVVERLGAIERAERAEARLNALEKELRQHKEVVIDVIHDATAGKIAAVEELTRIKEGLRPVARMLRTEFRDYGAHRVTADGKTYLDLLSRLAGLTK